MVFHRSSSYHGHDTSYREPLHPSDSRFYQHDNYQQESQIEATAYLPPQNLDVESPRAAHSPQPYNNDEFRRISEMLLEKIYEKSDPSMSANQFLNEYLTSVERARFSASLVDRYKSLSMFPSVDERDTHKLVRQLEQAFGKATMRTMSNISPEAYHGYDINVNHYHSNMTESPQSQMQHYHQPHQSRNTRQSREQRSSRTHYSSPRTDDSGYIRKIHQMQEGTPSLNLTASPRGERHNPRHYERQSSRGSNPPSRQELKQPSFSETSLSSPILMKRKESYSSTRTDDSRYNNNTYQMREDFPSHNATASPRGGNRKHNCYERQSSYGSSASSRRDLSLSPRGNSNTIPILEIKPATPQNVYDIEKTPRSVDASDSAIQKEQDAMEKALMQEIEATTKMLGTLSPRSNDYRVYSKHLEVLQGKLQEMEILEIDQVLEPAEDMTLGSGPVVEMDEIIPPKFELKPKQSKDRTTKAKTTDNYTGGSKEESKTVSGKLDQDKRKNGRKNGIPIDVTVDKYRNSRDDSITMDTSGFDTEKKKSSSSVLKVVAPADLPEGYDLQVIYEGEVMTVQVPRGGVSKGETFESTVSNPRTLNQTEPGKWKGSLFECLAFGIDHPLFFHSCFCPQIALTQIMARMNLSNYGDTHVASEPRRGIKTVLLLSVGLLILNILLICSAIFSGSILVIVFSSVVFTLLNVPTLLSFCHIAVLTRRATRRAYNIPEQQCDGCEDLLISVWCTSCSIAQMMRHTADYSTYRAVWFSETGLPDHVLSEPPSMKSGTLV